MTEVSANNDGVATAAEVFALAVGPWHQREFSAATHAIATAREWPTVREISGACEFLKDCDQPPELIFLAQPLPGMYSQAEVDRLQQMVPLARIVIVAGSWCEGELRTGAPPTGVIHLYWYELAPWWQAAIRRRATGLCPLWSAPLDHPQAGRWSSSADTPLPDRDNLVVLIDTADYAVYETLAFALADWDVSTIWHRHAKLLSPTVAGIWDGSQLGPRELERLTEFCQRVNGLVLALLDFPRVEHFAQAKLAGATAVFGKPYVVEEIVQALGTAVLEDRPHGSPLH